MWTEVNNFQIHPGGCTNDCEYCSRACLMFDRHELFDVLTNFLRSWRIHTSWRMFVTCYIFNVMTNFWHHDAFLSNVLMSWRNVNVMTNFLISWRIFVIIKYFLTSWQTFWRHALFNDMTNFLTSWTLWRRALFDVMTIFLTSWRFFLRHDVLFLHYDELLDVTSYSWYYDKRFDVMTYFDVMMNFLTS